MNILISGASGMIGRALVTHWSSTHQITVLGRDKDHLRRCFPEIQSVVDWNDLTQLEASSFDLVIQLAGHNIAASRWSEHVKKQIIDSRVKTTEALSHWILASEVKPRMICANAIGIYGVQSDHDSHVFDEDSPINLDQPADFPAKICTLWQKALDPLKSGNVSVSMLRFGPVLAKNEGMLGKLFWPFNLGLGTVIGSGKQTISWVHIDDVVAVFDFLIQHPEMQGVFNVTAPQPCSQRQFADALAHALKRPRLLFMPAFAVKLLFGEMGEFLLLKGQKVQSKRLHDAGFVFKHQNIDACLMDTY